MRASSWVYVGVSPRGNMGNPIPVGYIQRVACQSGRFTPVTRRITEDVAKFAKLERSWDVVEAWGKLVVVGGKRNARRCPKAVLPDKDGFANSIVKDYALNWSIGPKNATLNPRPSNRNFGRDLRRPPHQNYKYKYEQNRVYIRVTTAAGEEVSPRGLTMTMTEEGPVTDTWILGARCIGVNRRETTGFDWKGRGGEATARRASSTFETRAWCEDGLGKPLGSSRGGGGVPRERRRQRIGRDDEIQKVGEDDVGGKEEMEDVANHLLRSITPFVLETGMIPVDPR
ncbi:hypothetical protein C8R47DRAFT_1189710 [Mycena vitilis]|nr:hypothetical protein C8R47DRAFT_1189710 [Mycena vitilis]